MSEAAELLDFHPERYKHLFSDTVVVSDEYIQLHREADRVHINTVSLEDSGYIREQLKESPNDLARAVTLTSTIKIKYEFIKDNFLQAAPGDRIDHPLGIVLGEAYVELVSCWEELRRLLRSEDLSEEPQEQ